MENIKIENKFIKTVIQSIIEYNMLQKGDSILLGVSGGPDSVALLYTFIKISSLFSISKIGVVHLNHCLRGNDSDYDELFIKNLCLELKIQCYSKKEDVIAYKKNNKLSLEDAARRVRYAFFNQISNEYEYNKIALGHNSDDNAELILMNLIRGSGKLGLSGIAPVRNNIIRPLIKISKAKILDFLYENDLKFTVDKSNYNTNFFRNKIRYELLPFLKNNYNPKILDSINRTGFILRSEEEWIETQIESIFNKIVSLCGYKTYIISISLFDELNIALQRRILRKTIEKVQGDLKKVTFLHINSVINLAKNINYKKTLYLPNKIRILLTKKEIIVSNETKKDNIYENIYYEFNEVGEYFINEINVILKFELLKIGDINIFCNHNKLIALFDYDKICFPLNLRSFIAGDKFTPLGMKGSQKVKNFFINNKISKSKRLKCPILLSKNKIIWITGYRIDDSVKITNLTQNVLKAEISLFK